MQEGFPFAALDYNERMVVASPHLNDWGATDATYFADYATESGQTYQHGAGAILFAQDADVMGWLFAHVREA